MLRTRYALVILVLVMAPAAHANLIANPNFGAGGSSWSTNALTEIGSWAESDGNCAYVSRMSDGAGQVWQYIPSWKLPTTNVSLYYWHACKKWFGQDNTSTVMIYGLRTAAAVSGGYTPGGTNEVDYEILAGAGGLVMGNGFWWSSEVYKWTIGPTMYGYPTRQRYPYGLLVYAGWGGGGSNGAGMDNFVLQAAAANKGALAGDPLIGTPTGQPYQSAVTYELAYTGVGINSPLWIDPEWAIGYEYEITTNEYWNSFKTIELVPIGNSLYDIDVWDTATSDWLEVATDLGPGQVSFSTIAPGRSVKKFRVRGIDPGAEIDPDGYGFPIGVMFTGGGWSHTITMTAIVPEPTTLWLLALAALALRRLRRFR
ncbi:MAG: PEP-CTERM sorting domain-containing protein [Phycisphaerae bacterium]|nr:PEP-CTERM sorting domain-containing protein [Phycisphaerae bacterium]